MEDPPDQAYGRMSNPQRFAPLLLAADTLVADLAERFEVTATRGPATLRPASAIQPIESIRITAPHPDQAPLTITTTSFPGLYLDIGAWQHIALPACGCDACDEQVDDAVEDLIKYCTAAAEGRLSEHLDDVHGVLEHAWDGDGWSSRGTRTLSFHRMSELRAGTVQPPPDGHWRPWATQGPCRRPVRGGGDAAATPQIGRKPHSFGVPPGRMSP
ncbi:hypothetical protein IM25_23805 (plasmid) [Rhodococcus sp. p52]|uniref:DUF6226 family protein n=1 Tax=Rhodococcus sp. p52 TaxID=935199 RepID=UPI00051A505F|nr:DUF6226 family protein [Rhodococcus sp. p52]AOD24694.1 hypothetical protein IM25_23360 [Rhodococcus sp. p52]AOD24764.1 hypothetical protein IM25_23805 [Rhodococcus sp. p52]